MTAVSDPPEPPPDSTIRDAIVDRLDDRSVQSIAALRSGGRFAFDGEPNRFAALVVEELPTEFAGFGDPVRIADLMVGLGDWGCVEVDLDAAPIVAERLVTQAGIASHFYGSLHFDLPTPAPRISDPAVRLLGRADLALIRAADPVLGASDLEPLLGDGLVVGAVVDHRLVSRASCSARSDRYGDIGVATLEGYRGRRYATACASILARRLQSSGMTPVWSTGETNRASQRVASRLGFTLTKRRTYVVTSAGGEAPSPGTPAEGAAA